MKKNKKVLKVVTAVTSLAVVSAISFGATMAYLTAKTSQRTNTFSSGGIDIILKEPSWTMTEAHYSPGQNVPKDPTVQTASKEESTFVAIALQYWKKDSGSWKQMTDTEFANIASLQKSQPGGGFVDGINADWVYEGTVGTNTYVYYYAENATPTFKELAPEAETNPLFNNVSFKTTLEKKDMPDIKIVVSAYAVRADSYKVEGVVNNENVEKALKKLIQTNAPSLTPTD